MSTITIDIEPKLFRQAESILKDIGLSYSQAVDLFTRQIVLRNELPLNLKGDNRPPIPCIDDLTEEELDALIQEGLDDIEAGRYYTADEVEHALGLHKKEVKDEYAVAL